MERHASNLDELFQMMQEDEQRDKAEALKKLTPIEYAKLRRMAPQRVYYFLRNHVTKNDVTLQTEMCQCGRKVLDVEAADKFFGLTPTPEEEDDDDA